MVKFLKVPALLIKLPLPSDAVADALGCSSNSCPAPLLRLMQLA
jgi:hypothetical protein